MKLSLITNQPEVAQEADDFGIDRIMIDLEHKGKELRQSGLNLFLSDHRLEDVAAIKNVLRNASLMVRVNPPGQLSQKEIDAVISSGADYLMLPYFHRVEEVHHFAEQVAGRSKISLLVETSEAANHLAELSQLSSVHEIHIGLNDLRISRNYKSIFEPLYTGVIEELCAILKKSGKAYGFGGIGKLSDTALPVNPVSVLAEQVRLGCSNGWLGRTFRDGMNSSQMEVEIKLIRKEILKWQQAATGEFKRNSDSLYEEIKVWEKQERSVESDAYVK